MINYGYLFYAGDIVLLYQIDNIIIISISYKMYLLDVLAYYYICILYNLI